ncbi:3'-5' RNA helicase YTHDC2-like isoform X2 [Anthonomus grandis grandis]|uniref:3'-5' RNA helicase YTHDC2-like isoform X2 n=1 Tax=Anthonomus grandis grandis TaxID=2921223 RepID=UPI002165BCCE|nr:3'-5' RNA helicase YTHDC2-like isoform X2 [Anthonomus grandis grandis]
MAQLTNLVSKSHGREPNRQLHLKKKPKQAASQSFHVFLCDEIYNELQEFDKNYGNKLQNEPQHFRPMKRSDKVYGRLQDTEPVIPPGTMMNAEMTETRSNLPIFEKRANVLEVIHMNQVTIICSETGSGKTTQIPQYLLEEAYMLKKPCKIICTQPRRISTIAAAERVAYERGEVLGAAVGYHIRLESKSGPNTNLLFCTVGVFLRSLMCGNKCLHNISYIIVDEIHERDKLSDFLLICLKQNLSNFPNLKVILMSATVDTTKFQTYFNSSAVLSIPGRLYPIQTFFLGDILSMTQFMTGHMRSAMAKLQQKRESQLSHTMVAAEKPKLSEQDQANLNCALEAYMNYSDDYDYNVHYEEATADLMQLFITEDVPVDQQHSDRGWTALMIACHLGDIEFISKLFTLGANLDVYDAMGKTAWDYAQLADRRDVLEMLSSFREQKNQEKSTADTDNSQFLLQLYDMSTPDDFIDYDLITELIKYIHANSDRGSILVFLPGYDEIMQCNDNVLDSGLPISEYRIFFLHSSMNMKDQCDVFKPLPQRKLILSTNIAETSITVEDVVFVIDVGKAKEKVYDAYNKLSVLQTQWISRACAKQRQGRAGRVSTGFCFRLYSQQRFKHMPEERVPEILRVSLEELCLHAKIIAPKSMNIYDFLCLAPDPPTPNAVQVAVENLQALGALDKEEDLHKLGEYLAQLTLEPRLGKMLILACIFKCLEPMLTICAGMAHRDPFQLPPQANLKTVAAAKRRELLGSVPSDHAIYLLVFQKWQDEVTRGRSKQFCYEYFISETTMYSVLDTRRQLLGQLRAVGFVNNNYSIEDFNHNSNSWGLVKAIMCSAFFPNVAFPVQRGAALNTRSEKKVSIHNTSVCQAKKYEHWTFYDEMVRNRITFMIRGVTLCSPLMVSVMCGVDVVYPSSHSVAIDDWLEFYFGDILAIKFRKTVQSLVDKSLSNPFYSYERCNLPITETLRNIMDSDDKNLGLAQPKNVGQRPKFLFRLGQENAASRPNRSNTKDNGGFQRFAPTHNRSGGNSLHDKCIEQHKKGLTPKRFIPPATSRYNGARQAARNLQFDHVSEGSNDISQSFGALSIHQPGPSTPGDLLLQGLGPQNPMTSTPFYTLQQTYPGSTSHDRYHYNGNHGRSNQFNSGNSAAVVNENVVKRPRKIVKHQEPVAPVEEEPTKLAKSDMFHQDDFLEFLNADLPQDKPPFNWAETPTLMDSNSNQAESFQYNPSLSESTQTTGEPFRSNQNLTGLTNRTKPNVGSFQDQSGLVMPNSSQACGESNQGQSGFTIPNPSLATVSLFQLNQSHLGATRKLKLNPNVEPFRSNRHLALDSFSQVNGSESFQSNQGQSGKLMISSSTQTTEELLQPSQNQLVAYNQGENAESVRQEASTQQYGESTTWGIPNASQANPDLFQPTNRVHTSFMIPNCLRANVEFPFFQSNQGGSMMPQNRLRTYFRSATAELERVLQYPDDPVFLFIKANEKKNIDIAQSAKKWVFSPQTEKKVIGFAEKGRKVLLVYYVRCIQMFMGIAQFKGLHVGKTFSKPTASIEWIHCSPIHKNKFKQVMNPYDDSKPVYDSDDGMVIKKDIGETIMRIYAQVERNRVDIATDEESQEEAFFFKYSVL